VLTMQHHCGGRIRFEETRSGSVGGEKTVSLNRSWRRTRVEKPDDDPGWKPEDTADGPTKIEYAYEYRTVDNGLLVASDCHRGYRRHNR